MDFIKVSSVEQSNVGSSYRYMIDQVKISSNETAAACRPAWLPLKNACCDLIILTPAARVMGLGLVCVQPGALDWATELLANVEPGLNGRPCHSAGE
ncbi:hypothetical protein ACFWXH_18025 [Mesorhizobium sp. NPDC059054]|uniref:hypothetical protein n=1 Tax=Mesorhizobium sp. NPDC059054 TaxID=3346711 RepID=UPI0036BC68DE